MSKKLKVLIHSDFVLSCTGFGKNAKNILNYLYNTGKYELITLNCDTHIGHPFLNRTPWKSYGAVPMNQQEVNQILNQHPPEHRETVMKLMRYGTHALNELVYREKPDVYIGIQDIWGIDQALNMPWFDKIHSVLWTTLDSLPLLPSAVAIAPKVKNYWVWSSFATNEMHRLGHKHVKTLHGPIDHKNFYRLDNNKRSELRKRFNLTDEFIIGFVFRNQLRKSVPNLLEGFKIFKKENPKSKAKLLLHTNYMECWNIPMLMAEYGIDPNDVLCTYFCKSCREYEIKPFAGHDIQCRFCKTEKSCATVAVQAGVNEEQLNEIYNLLDTYVLAISSGGQEITAQEAKLSELITLVTNYSCGEEMCCPEAYSFPLDWAEYREHNTHFKKASTYPTSIAKQLKKVYEMNSNDRREYGRRAREWTIKNYSIENIGKQLETFLDNLVPTNYDWVQNLNVENTPPNGDITNEELTQLNDHDFIVTCYRKILGRDPDEGGYKHWTQFLA